MTVSGVESLSDTMTLVFDAGFALSSISVADIALSHGVTTGFETQEALSTSAAAGVWGVAISGQTITLTPPTDVSTGEIVAGHRVVVRIGTSAEGFRKLPTLRRQRRMLSQLPEDLVIQETFLFPS